MLLVAIFSFPVFCLFELYRNHKACSYHRDLEQVAMNKLIEIAYKKLLVMFFILFSFLSVCFWIFFFYMWTGIIVVPEVSNSFDFSCWCQGLL